MENENREFGLFIDGLRLERNMSREDLCEGVMSLSQYKRYLRGDTSIPNGKLILIAEKLKFSINDIYFLFRKKHNDEYNQIDAIYNLILRSEFDKAFEEAKKFIKTIFVSDYNKLFFDFCLITIQYNLNMVSDIHVLDMYSDLIDYPSCKDNTSFNMVEMSTLIYICNISNKIDNPEPTDILYRIISSPNFVYTSGSEGLFMPPVYATISRILYTQEQFEKVIEVTNNGLSYCLRMKSLNSIVNLLLLNSLSHYKLDQIYEAEESAIKCFMQLHIEGDESKFNDYKTHFENATGIDLELLLPF